MTYEVIPFRLDAHVDALAALWRENMSDARIGAIAPARMTWLYERNPEGAARTFLARVRGSEEVVGCGSVVLRRLHVGGRAVTAGLLADFAVARGHRKASAALAIQRAIAAAGVPIRYGYPNGKSLAVFKRLGYRVVGESTRWVKPLRSADKLPVLLRRSRVARAAVHVVDAGLVALDGALSAAHASRGRLHGGPRTKTFDATRADARFDRLWASARSHHGVAGARSADYLNWRYAALPGDPHRFFCLGAPYGDSLLGYVVYRLRYGGVATVEDFFCEDRDQHGAPLLVALGRHLRHRGASTLACSYVGPPSFSRQLRAAGFFRRPGARTLVAHVDACAPAGLADAVMNRDAWLVMDGELDL